MSGYTEETLLCRREKEKEREHIESDEPTTVFEDFRSSTEQSRDKERLIQQAARNVEIGHGGNGAGTLKCQGTLKRLSFAEEREGKKENI